jgi:hypothetical protein
MDRIIDGTWRQQPSVGDRVGRRGHKGPALAGRIDDPAACMHHPPGATSCSERSGREAAWPQRSKKGWRGAGWQPVPPRALRARERARAHTDSWRSTRPPAATPPALNFSTTQVVRHRQTPVGKGGRLHGHATPERGVRTGSATSSTRESSSSVHLRERFLNGQNGQNGAGRGEPPGP